MSKYTRLPANEAIEKALDVRRADIQSKTKEELIHSLLEIERSHMEEMVSRPWELSNYVSAVTGGKYGVERTDLKPR